MRVKAVRRGYRFVGLIFTGLGFSDFNPPIFTGTSVKSSKSFSDESERFKGCFFKELGEGAGGEKNLSVFVELGVRSEIDIPVVVVLILELVRVISSESRA